MKVCFVYNTKEELLLNILYQVSEIVKSIGSQDGVVGTATCYKLDGLGFEYQQRQEILQNHPYRSQPPIQWVQGFFHESKVAQGGEIDHTLPSSAEVENERSYTYAFPICLHGMDRDIFI
jgi:hypothetical protein